MMTSRRAQDHSDESTSSSSTKYSVRSFETAATSLVVGPDPEDPGWYATARTYPIMANHPIVKSWSDGLCENVMREVRKLNSWESVDVLRRGLSLDESECPPTVIISITPGSMEEMCRDVADRIKRHFENGNLDAGVEILESSVIRNVAIDEVEKAVGIGSSIGLLEDGSATGTVGGYVRLEKVGMAPKICAMTCHHVVVFKESSSLNTFTDGISPSNWQALATIMNSPSTDDLQDSLQSCRGYQRVLQDRMKETEEMIQMGVASDVRKQGLGKESQTLEWATARVAKLEGFRSFFGHVFASSGFRIAARGCAVDWGLVEVDQERIGGNVLRQVGAIFSPPTRLVNEIEDFKLNDMAYKFGRSTDFTRGRYSFIQSQVRLPDSPSETTEHVFLGANRGQLPFSSDGDSGAWVFGQLGKLGGLLIGGHVREGWTYATPMSVVIADIEARLECKVMLYKTSN